MKLPHYIIGLLALCLQTSCDKGNSTIVGQTEPKEGIEAELVSHLIQYVNAPTLVLPQGTTVGIYAAPYEQAAEAATAACSNIRCVSGLSGELDAAGELKLQEGKDYSFYAYAPYKDETQDNPQAIPFMHNEDVLLCTGSPSLLKVGFDNRNVSLNFIHRTSQIRFIVKVKEDANVENLQPTSVLRVSGFLPEAQLNLNTGELTPTGKPSEQTDVQAVAAPNEKGIYELASDPVCFFATPDSPQTIHLRVNHAGDTHTGDITTIFVPGESLLYTIWIDSKPQLEVSAFITDWVNQYESIKIN